MPCFFNSYLKFFQFVSPHFLYPLIFCPTEKKGASIFSYFKQPAAALRGRDDFPLQAFCLEEEATVLNNSSVEMVDEKEIGRRVEQSESVKILNETADVKYKEIAANLIQKTFFKYLGIRKIQRQKNHASMQRVFIELTEKFKQKRAATVIQSIYRGHQVRCQLNQHFLPVALFKAAKPSIASGQIRQFSRSSSGKTPVCFHPDLPVIFKQSGSPQNSKRLISMIQAREVCQKHGYTSLVIPEARIHGDFIIERCLPLRDGLDQKKQVGLYVEHQELFIKAVEEFTAFLCQTTLDDLSGQNNDFWICLCSTRVGRYDNVALYLDEQKEAKIGLIDLETFSSIPSTSPKAVYQACLQAIRLFPLHFEQILAVAKRFDPQIGQYENDLQDERKQLLDYLDVIYRRHRTFAEEKGIVPGKDQAISEKPERLDEFAGSMLALWDSLRGKLSKIGSYESLVALRSYEAFTPEQISLFFSSQDPTDIPPFIQPADRKELVLSEDKLKTLKEETFPELYAIALRFMNRLLEGKISSSYPSMLFNRSLIFDEKSPSYLALQEEVSAELSKVLPFQNDFQKKYATDCIVKGIFQELVRIGNIAYYNPEFGFRSNPQHCIFC